jgi:polar amino acid transport system substrate-binding protein
MTVLFIDKAIAQRYHMTMHGKKRWLLDLLAISILMGYGWIVRYTERGAADPIWTTVQQERVLRVGVDPGFRPFAEQRDGQLQGYDIDLVNELAKRLGLRAEFVPVGYDALYDALSTQRVDMLAAALPLAPEQGWRARFSTPYLNAGQLLVVPESAVIENEGQLGGLVVGVALGSEGDTFVRRLRRDLPTMMVQSSFETPDAALAALAANQLDAVITDAVSALAAISRYDNLKIARALTFDPYVLAVPVSAYQLQREVDRALDEMRHDNVFDQLNAKWFR